MFLSIDGGFKNLGVAVWNDDNTLYYSGVWPFRERGEAEPFSAYRDAGVLDRFFKFQTLDYKFIVAETMPMQSMSIQRALTLATMVGIRISARLREAEWYELSATTVKKYITGNGRATKAQMRRKMTELYPQMLEGKKLGDVMFDEADAVAVGHTWIGRNGKS